MVHFEEIMLSEVAEVQTGPFGSQLHMEDYVENGTPIITVEHLGENRILHKNLPLVSDEDKQRLKKYTIQKGDIVFSRVGSVDRRAYVSEQEEGWMFSGRLLRVRALAEKVNSKYLSYFFGLEYFKDYIRMVAVGATMPSINTQILSEAPVKLLPLPEQTAIAEVLSSLDDKIDLLQRNNRTLEQLAETLFRQWFVETNLDNQQQIFLSDIAEHVKRSVNPGNSPNLIFEHFSIPSFDNGKNPESQTGSEILSNKYVVTQGVILISKLNPSTPRVWYVHECCETAVCSTEFQVFRAKEESFNEFLYCFLKSNDVTDTLSTAASGTSGSHQRVSPEIICRLPLSKPSKEKVISFHKTVGEWLQKVNLNQQSIKILIGLRDSLLPKLMSGEITVKL